MKKTILATLAAALIASVAAPAFAAPQNDGPRHGPRIARMMERFDADRNGAVSQEEVSQHRLTMFKAIDADASDSISKDELKAFGDMRMEKRDEMRKERRAERAAMTDGKMMGDHKGKHGDHDGKMADRRDGKRDGKRHGEGRGDHKGGPRMERLDADKNGEISLQEFTAMDTKMFGRFDRNGDGKIDITDFYRQSANKN